MKDIVSDVKSRTFLLPRRMAAVILSLALVCLATGCSRRQDGEGRETTGNSEAETAFQTESQESIPELESGSIPDAVGGATSDPIYIPGIYQGSARGYGGTIRVTVEVDENHILSIEAEGSDETEGVGKVALEKLPPLIIEANGAEIDGMTGATYSSQGLFEAVKDALAQAYSGE